MLAKTLKFSIFKSPNKPTLMTNILINYFRVLEVTSIMVKWIIAVFIYELIGFILYIKGCLEYNKNEKDKF